MPLQLQFLAHVGRECVDRLRWRACWLLMPPLGFAQEKRRLQRIAQDCGASRASAVAIASRYFNTLRDRDE